MEKGDTKQESSKFGEGHLRNVLILSGAAAWSLSLHSAAEDGSLNLAASILLLTSHQKTQFDLIFQKDVDLVSRKKSLMRCRLVR